MPTTCQNIIKRRLVCKPLNYFIGTPGNFSEFLINKAHITWFGKPNLIHLFFLLLVCELTFIITDLSTKKSVTKLHGWKIDRIQKYHRWVILSSLEAGWSWLWRLQTTTNQYLPFFTGCQYFNSVYIFLNITNSYSKF